jgi:uncharacterized protein YeaO (DUF488 family)
MTPAGARREPPTIEVQRVYESGTGQGKRYLVERLWPRGMRKDDVRLDGWVRDVAPSAELRRWFAHDPEKWKEFRRRYFAELDSRPEAWRPLAADASRGRVVLLFSARDTEHNNAIALKQYLKRHRPTGRSRARPKRP